MNKSYITCFYFSIIFITAVTFTSFRSFQTVENEIEANYEKFKEFRSSEPQTALKHAVIAYDLALESKDSLWVMKSSRAAGYMHNSFGSYDTGYYYLLRSIEYGELLKDEAHLMRVHNDAGLNRRNVSKFDEALDHFFSSLIIREKVDNKADLSIIYNNIGLIYYDLTDFKKSIEYHSKSLEINQELNDQGSAVINLVNIGLCYMGNQEHSIAQNYFGQVLEICKEDCPIEVNIQALGGLGTINFDQNNFKTAKNYFTLSNEISIESDILKYLPSNYNYLAHIYFEEQEVDSALILLNTSQEYALEAEDIDWIMNNLRLYATIHAETQDFEQAFFYHENYVSLRDSTYNDDLIQNLSDIHVNLQKSKDDTIIQGLDNEIIAITQQTIMFALSTLAVSVLLFLVYKNNKVRKRINAKLGEANLTIENQNLQLNEMNQQLDLKVKERTEKLLRTNYQLAESKEELDNFIYKTSHDIQGPLATLKGVCNIATLELKDDLSLGHIKRISDTATNLNDILSQLQVVNNINNTELDAKSLDFTTILASAQREAEVKHLSEKPIRFESNVVLSTEVYFDKFLIEVIINNLVSNGFKFYNDSRSIDSFVSCHVEQSSEALSISVTDNGIGIDDEKVDLMFRMFTRFSDRNRVGGIGLYLVKSAVDRLKGKIIYAQTKEGYTRFTIEIPIEQNS